MAGGSGRVEKAVAEAGGIAVEMAGEMAGVEAG
jgi:hypothetical protein